MFTTPQRPIDVVALFPELAFYAKTATRLHPRSGMPKADESSVAGPLLWPDDEPWPTCVLPHLVEIERPATAEEQEEWRRADEARARSAALLPKDEDPASPLAKIHELRRRAAAEAANRPPRTTVRVWEPAVPAEPVPMVPVVQLLASDLPETVFPAGADVVQLLWCPYQHQNVPGQKQHYIGPVPKLIWRRVEHLTRAMAAANEGPNGYVLKPCVLHPEQVTEFPDLEDLPEFLQSRIYEWQEAAEEDPENEEDRPGYDYRNDLCTASGLKAGGWPYWPHCPRPVQCACGADMSLLLTIPNGERGAQSWTPVEEQHVTTRRAEDPAFYDPTGFRGARDELMVFVCQQDPCHEPFIDIE